LGILRKNLQNISGSRFRRGGQFKKKFRITFKEPILKSTKQMELNAARKLAIDTMNQHGLLGQYTFKFIDSVNVCGKCITYGFSESSRRPSKRKGGYVGEIVLSKKFVLNNTDLEVTDTILHEIAHAMCNLEHGLIERNGQVIHHGFEWRKMAIRVGAKPNRCAGDEVYIPKKYKLICTNEKCFNFNGSVAERDKRSSKKYRCKRCKEQLSWRVNLKSSTPPKPSGVEIFS